MSTENYMLQQGIGIAITFDPVTGVVMISAPGVTDKVSLADLANATNNEKGAALVGYLDQTVAAVLDSLLAKFNKTPPIQLSESRDAETNDCGCWVRATGEANIEYTVLHHELTDWEVGSTITLRLVDVPLLTLVEGANVSIIPPAEKALAASVAGATVTLVCVSLGDTDVWEACGSLDTLELT